MFIQERKKSIEEGQIDWATAEAMALGSLAFDGFNSRLVGEDSERGTFSQRHLVFHDQVTGEKCMPIRDSQYMQDNLDGRIQVFNTNLCELGTMAYEYGYSLENPKNLCIWEAQFGDFYNPAQLVVDQYLMCSESKWLRQSGMVLLLPHGFDGTGPEHSTCHIERFLQNVNSSAYDSNGPYDNLTAQNINFQVAQPTMPANYFHLLRRQMLRDFRKPMVIAAPKQGLKHAKAVSDIADFSEGNYFHPVLANKFGEGQTRHVIFCSGKVAFDIAAKLEKESIDGSILVVRCEELAPFPIRIIKALLNQEGVGNDAKFTWMQEEPVNQGAFQFAKLHLDRMLHERGAPSLGFIGRRAIHSFATGANSCHKAENIKLWKDFDQHVLH